MGLVRTRKTLASATRTGGARVASAGGGLPQRITTPVPIVLAGACELRGGFVWDPDGLHVWTTRRTSNTIVKINVASGSVITTISTNVSSPESISRARGSTKAYVACSGNQKTIEVNLLTAVGTAYATPTAAPYHVIEGGAGKAWMRITPASGAGYAEFTLATGVVTGRNSPSSSFDAAYDATTGKLFFLNASTFAVQRVVESTNTVDLTWSIDTNAVGVPGYGNQLRAMVLDPNGAPVVADLGGHVYRYLAASAALDKRLVHPAAEFGLPAISSVAQARFGRSFMAWNDAGDVVGWIQYNSTGASLTDMLDVRIVQMATARARWALATGSGSTVAVQEITAPGAHGNEWWAVTTPPAGQPSSAYDYRRTRWYWSTNGGASRTEFSPGDDLTLVPVTIAAGGTLTIDADMTTWEMPLLAEPWVGGTNGEGIGVLWDDPDVGVSQRSRLLGSL